MVSDLLLNLILVPIAGLINLLPAIGSGLGLNTLATTITTSSYWPPLGWANNYFPLTLIISLFITTIGIILTTLGIRIALWVYHQFWGSN